MSSYDHQILKPSRLGDDKAVLTARVVEIQAGSQEPSVARVRVPGAIVRPWWHVRLLLKVGCLGFVHDMPWSTFVLLVSSGEGLMCSDLIGRHGLLGLEDLDTAVSNGSCEMPWSLDAVAKRV